MKQEDYTFSTEIKVRDYEVDAQGIVNNARYLHYLEHTRHEFCEMAGYTFRQMHQDGCDPVMKRAEVDYLTSLGPGDTMVSCLDIIRKGARYIFRQDIYRQDGTPVLRAITTIVTLRDGRPTRGDELAEVFGPYLKTDV